MQILTDTLWGYLVDGEFKQFFITLLNSYFPYAVPFWLLALGIFAAVHAKTKNLGYAGAVTSVYMCVISGTEYVVNAHAIMALRIVGILTMVTSGYYLYRVSKG